MLWFQQILLLLFYILSLERAYYEGLLKSDGARQCVHYSESYAVHGGTLASEIGPALFLK